MMPVTCIIPVRNGTSTIELAIASAINAGCDAVIAYDDGSSDNSYQVLLSLVPQYGSHLQILGQLGIKAGVNFARNFLIHAAPNGLIIPLDADDILGSIEPLKAAYEPGVWVYGDYVEHDGKSINPIKGAAPGSLTRKNITGVTFLFHKSDWAKVGGYDPDFAYAEDYAFQCALVNAGVKPKYVEEVVYARFLHLDGNERTAKAQLYWTFYRDMARSKYPAAFQGVG